MRSLVALLTTISMFHLTLVGADLACASHPMSTSEAMAGMGDDAGAAQHGIHASMAAAASDVDASAVDANGCTTPVQPRCCDGMSSCSVTTAVTAAVRLISHAPPCGSVIRHISAEPASVRAAPEPPPPKA